MTSPSPLKPTTALVISPCITRNSNNDVWRRSPGLTATWVTASAEKNSRPSASGRDGRHASFTSPDAG
ncbi:MAG: hypothetical protein AB7O66_22700, partial [Limisphaerales bacterium]